MEPLKIINVLWIDDRHAEMRDFKVRAEQLGVKLHPYRSSEKGLAALEERLHFFDAVLLDGLFALNEEQEEGTERLNALSIAVARLNQLKNIKNFKHFILTGQETLEQSEQFKDMFGDFYLKRDPKSVQQLFKDLRLAAEAMADTQIRHRFQRVFEVCTDRYIGEAAASELLIILRRENDEASITEATSRITAIRKIIEDLFRACNREGLVPEAFITGNVKLSATSKFLSGITEDGYKLAPGTVPDLVGSLIKNILAVAQPASHRAQVDAHMTAVHSPYLLYSITYTLLDVLLWFKSFVDARAGAPDKPDLFSRIEGERECIVAGIIEQDDQKNYHCGDILLGFKYTEANFEIGDAIEIKAVAVNTNTLSAITYPKRATSFHKA